MKTVEVTVYNFDELPPEVQTKTLDRYRDINADYDWFEDTIDDWKEQLKEKGYGDCKINFSGFWSQGDGASFTSTNCDIEKLFPLSIDEFKPLKDHLDLISVYINRHNHHYSHEKTCILHLETKSHFPECLDSLVLELEKHLEENRLDLCRKIYRDLEKEYEYLNSDEAVKETILINEFLFTLEGKIWRE